jgi:2-hydroxycyclohexanecarboxyl-CoA dehydrogenase
VVSGVGLVVVTGAAGDVGRAVVERLAAGGTRVVAADNRPISSAIAELPGVDGARVDLADDASVRALADQVLAQQAALAPVGFGVVHCAGLAQITPFAESDPGTWDLLYRINQRGPLLLTQALLPALTGGGASVVFVGSDSARAGAGGEVVYAATKAALMGAAKSLARELARHGTRVNVVSPGPIAGAMSDQLTREDPDYLSRLSRAIPLRRLASPQDVASSIAWLLGPESTYVTGQTLSVSGGITMN